MARLTAQVLTLVFLLVCVAGLVAGNAGPQHPGGGGNLGAVTLHSTWARDVLDLAFLAAFAYVGFVAARHAGRVTAAVLGALLLALGIAGFLIGDTANASRSVAGVHFTTAFNLLDVVTGALALLAALGTVEDPEPPPRSVLRG